jgi:C4-type Zn-finger protein
MEKEKKEYPLPCACGGTFRKINKLQVIPGKKQITMTYLYCDRCKKEILIKKLVEYKRRY